MKPHLARELLRNLLASTARAHHGESHSNRPIYHIPRNALSLSNWCLKCPPAFGEAQAVIVGNKHTSSVARVTPSWGKRPASSDTDHTNISLFLQAGRFRDVREVPREELLWREPQSLLLLVPARLITGGSGESGQIVGTHLSCVSTQ